MYTASKEAFPHFNQQQKSEAREVNWVVNNLQIKRCSICPAVLLSKSRDIKETIFCRSCDQQTLNPHNSRDSSCALVPSPRSPFWTLVALFCLRRLHVPHTHTSLVVNFPTAHIYSHTRTHVDSKSRRRIYWFHACSRSQRWLSRAAAAD
jgi:hypothetical protein